MKRWPVMDWIKPLFENCPDETKCTQIPLNSSKLKAFSYLKPFSPAHFYCLCAWLRCMEADNRKSRGHKRLAYLGWWGSWLSWSPYKKIIHVNIQYIFIHIWISYKYTQHYTLYWFAFVFFKLQNNWVHIKNGRNASVLQNKESVSINLLFLLLVGRFPMLVCGFSKVHIGPWGRSKKNLHKSATESVSPAKKHETGIGHFPRKTWELELLRIPARSF